MRLIAPLALFRLLIISVIITFTLTACSTRPKKLTPEQQQQKLAEVMKSGAYAVSGSGITGGEHEIWHGENGLELEVVTLSPNQAGSYPLVIYLPSLGEDAAAGKLWRESWAKAGYVVVSMQPVSVGAALRELGPLRVRGEASDDTADDDAEEENDKADKSDNSKNKDKDNKPTKLGRSSELRYLGHEYFAIDALKNRMQALFWGYQQIAARVRSGEAGYAKADLSKIVLVGYDLGAQTAAAVLGENFKGDLPHDSNLTPLAGILLSPSIDLAEGNVRNRFVQLTQPLLVITGSEDNDPYAISSASVRAAIWEYSPAGQKYLLSLEGNVHSLLAGADYGVSFGRRQRDSSIWPDLGLGSSSGGGGNRRGNMQYSGGGQGHGGGRGKHQDNAGFDADRGYKQVAAVLSTSSAFMDAVVKHDEFALYWLKDQLNRLDSAGGMLKLR